MKTAIIYAGKTAIVYAGKYGATQEIANRLAAKIDGAEAFNLKGSTHPNLNDYDCVIIGSAVYAGAVQKEAKAFAVANEAALLTKRVGLFLSGMESDKEKVMSCFQLNYSKALLDHSSCKVFLGGRFDPKKANFFERTIFKLVAKQSTLVDTISSKDIATFAKIIVE